MTNKYYLIIALALFSKSILAKVEVDDCTYGACTIYISEAISSETAFILDNIVSEHKKKNKKYTFVLYVNSPGGDIISAINIGKIARRETMLVRVEKESSCYSSCVYILAGGVSRIIEGKVGIHAPYFPKIKNATYNEVQEKFNLLRNTVKEYLSQMNMPASFYEDMIKIPSHDIKILNYQELENYGLASDDPVFRETVDINKANELGITRDEYIRRKRLSDKICNPKAHISLELYADCLYKIMDGK